MGIGGGLYLVVALALVGALVILWIFPRFEEWIYGARDERTYEIVCGVGRDRLREMEEMFRECGLRVKGHNLVKKDQDMVCIIDAYGSPDCHERVMDRLLAESDVKEFRY
jgi:hypothetical protein